VTGRTNRQVTLAIKVLGKEVKRGLNFMEVNYQDYTLLDYWITLS
jgi:hypothetical protein